MNALQSLVARYQAWSAVREAEAELYAMTDRELADLGINRSDIAYLVRQGSGQANGSATPATDAVAHRA